MSLTTHSHQPCFHPRTLRVQPSALGPIASISTFGRLSGDCLWLLLMSILCMAARPAWAVSAATTTTTLAVTSAGSAATSVVRGSPITLTASVQVSGAAVTAGTVSFCDSTSARCSGPALLGSAQLTSSGKAALSLVPAVGSHSYRAVFAATTASAASHSAASALLVTEALATAATLTQASSGNYALTATVTGSASAAPTGTVSFVDSTNNNAVLATASLSVGTAALNFLSAASPAAGDTPDAIVAGDFNGDGIPDLAIANSGDNTVTILLGKGDGTFNAAASPATGNSPSALAVGDFNNDGIADLAVVNLSDSTVTILLGVGDGSFTGVAATSTTDQNPAGLAVGDFNQDGNLDLAIANTLSNTVTILLGNGDGTFNATTSLVTGNQPAAIAEADFNCDGIPDLAVVNSTDNTVSIFLGSGDGTFNITSAPSTGNSPSALAVGDFNNDGIADLAVANQFDDTVTILLGVGDGTFNAASAGPATGVSPSSIAALDLNGDGMVDLAVVNESDATVSILQGNGDGTFTATAATPAVGSNPSALAAADFNGDGRPDLATANMAGGNASVLLTQTQVATATAVPVGGASADLVFASYAGDSLNAASNSPSISLTSVLLTPSVNLTVSATSINLGSPVTLTATVSGSAATPTGSVTFLDGRKTLGSATLNASGVATFTTAALAIGSHSIVASYAGDSNFYSAFSAATSVVVSKATQTINFTTLATPVTYGSVKTIALAATSTSGLSVKFGVSGPASLESTSAGFQLIHISAGTIVVTASQNGNANYQAATPVTQTLVANKGASTVALTSSASVITAGGRVTLTATLSGVGDLPTGKVVFVISPTLQVTKSTKNGVATISTASLPAGQDSLTVSYAGDANHLSSVSPACIVSVGQKAQSIRFVLRSPVTYGAQPYPLNATAASKLPVTYAVTSGPGAINGNTFSVTGAGTVVVTTSVAGNATYAPATATQSVVVFPAKLTIAASKASVAYNQPLPTLNYTVNGYVNNDSASVLTGAPQETTTAQQGSAPGSYPITIAQGSLTAPNYAFQFKPSTLTITGLGTVAKPSFTPAPGHYKKSSVTVTISDSTSGAAIYYTLDRSTPTTSSTPYSGPITISGSDTFKAVGALPGYTNSPVATAAYSIR